MLKNNGVKTERLIPNDIQEMLNMHLNVEIDFDANLSLTQKKAFKLFKDKKSLLLIGSGGVGKSKLIKTMEEYTKNNTTKNIYLTSTTGVSAYNLNGVTIHSLLGIGTGELEIDVLIKNVLKKKMYRELILNIDILVIDEASMLSACLFEKINLLCQHIRSSSLFFGGIQLILSFDPLQLLPVFNKNKEIYKNIDERLIVESCIFNKNFEKENIIILKENFRQKNDPTFINILLRIRDGTYNKDDILLLNTRKIMPINPSNHVHLVTSNKKAQIININELEKLKTKNVIFTSNYSCSGNNTDIKNLLKKELEFQFNQKGIYELTLKKGCRVMLIKNIDVSIGLVNGAIGTIIDFITQIPYVEFDNGIKMLISPVNWELEMDNCKGNATQIPLMLAYALTIHKVQSLSLESAVLDLGDCFVNGQIYTALSRLKNLDGLYLKTFNPAKITVNKIMMDFLHNLE